MLLMLLLLLLPLNLFEAEG